MTAKRKPRKPETRGRPAIPPELRKVKLSVRVPARVKAGFEARAQAHGTDANGSPRSSVGLEVERAFHASTPRSPLGPIAAPDCFSCGQ